MADDAEKSFGPTPHRRQQARQRGEVAHSQDLSSAGLLLGSLVILVFTGGALLEFLAALVVGQLSGGSWLDAIQSGGQPDADWAGRQWHTLLPPLATALLPMLGLMLLLAAAVNIVQKGFWFLPHKVVPDASRVNPLAGLARTFSGGSVARLGLAIGKVALILGVAGTSLYGEREQIVSLAGQELPRIATATWEICQWTVVKIGIALVALAAVDYAYQRWRHEQSLKMTPQEMREEMRDLQGDPQVNARRRAVQRQLALGGLAHTVPQADVIITAPDELAVALAYDRATMAAPQVVAKGIGPIAARIRELAQQRGIPIVEKNALAEALHARVDVKGAVPDQLFRQVAEVLTYARELGGDKQLAST